MKSAKRLVIDIGTNSVLALLVELSEDGMKVISDRQKTTRLGEGLSKTGRLSEEAMLRTVEAIELYVTSTEFDSVFLVGTEALRVASNSDKFIELVERKSGYRPVVVSGRQEAELAFRGALFDLEMLSDDLIIADVGGGSTEIIRGKKDRIVDIVSIPLGALKLRQSVPVDEVAAYKEHATDIIGDRRFFDNLPSSNSTIGVGGTITSMAAVGLGLSEYDPGAVHGYLMNRAEIQSVATGFESASDKKRRELIPFDPQRADLILPGAGIFLAIMGIIGVNGLIVSTGGLRFGAALSPEKVR
jgi:exopolyphosphatase/guanosine-5'-triphosphate,3'-diphosphate pyrophosphatase